MNQRTIYLTASDHEKVVNLVQIYKPKSEATRKQFVQFTQALSNAVITAPENIPGNVITLHSQVQIKSIKENKDYTYTLVLPGESNIHEMKISILAPLGLALIGHTLGREIEYETEAGTFKYEITAILYQPERAGNYTL